MTAKHENPNGPHAPHRESGDPERIVPGTEVWERSYREHLQRYEFAAKQMPSRANALDAGCGAGYGAAYLAERGARQVVAVDISEEALQTAKAHFAREQIVWVQDDCQSLQACAEHAPYDFVCCLENIEHLQDPRKFLRRAAELLHPEGVLVASTPNRIVANRVRGVPPDTPPRNPYHQREFTGEEFRALLEEFFEEVRFAHQCHGQRTRARMALEPALQSLWTNPAMRLGRWIQRVLRGRNVPEQLDALLPALNDDWVVVEQDPGEDVSWVFLAVCRKPRKT